MHGAAREFRAGCMMARSIERQSLRAPDVARPRQGTISAFVPFNCRKRRHCAVDEQEKLMDKDRVAGAVDKAKGSVKKAVGDMTGDEKMQAEGEADKAKGKVKSTTGGVKDAVRDRT